MTNIILKGKKMQTRILRPAEYELLRKGAKHLESKINLDGCLALAARYLECVEIQNHPELFDSSTGFVHIIEKKAKRTDTDRWIRLSNWGVGTMEHFLANKQKLPKTPQGFRQNLRRWAVRAGLDPNGLSPRSLRKSMESWLVACYPHLFAQIVLSQGHTELTATKHYLGLPFIPADKVAMQKYVDGWAIL